MNHSKRTELGLGNHKGRLVDMNEGTNRWSKKSKTEMHKPGAGIGVQR